MEIPANGQLSPAETRVEADFSAAIQADPESFVQRYRERFGQVIDTDRARELCSAYSESVETRTRWSRAVYNPAKALADEIFRRTIRETTAAKILFTSGGTGAGKSTALAAMLGATTPAPQSYDVLVDGTLSDLSAATTKIQLALDAGHRVTIVHVHREFAETVRMVIERALEMGRAVTLDNVAATHFRSREVLFALERQFSGKIDVRVLENRTELPARAISLAELAAKRGITIDEMRDLAKDIFRNEFGSLQSSRPEIFGAFLQPGSRV